MSNPVRGLGHVLVSTMKNEGAYALEFVAHHRVLGFDGIYIASNDCTDGTDVLLDALSEAGAIYHAHNQVPEGAGPSHHGYSLLREQFGLNRAEWLMALDVDEFLYVSLPGGTVADLTSIVGNDADVIAISSLTFGDGQAWRPLDPQRVCRRFTRRVPDLHPTNGPIKSLNRDPARFRAIHNHSMVGLREDREAWAMRGDGSLFDLDPNTPMWKQLRNFESKEITHKFAHYNHYAVKTPDEFELRRLRGRGATADPERVRHTEEYFSRRADAATVPDTRILDRYGAQVEAEMDRLLALPGVAEAQRYCQYWLSRELGFSD